MSEASEDLDNPLSEAKILTLLAVQAVGFTAFGALLWWLSGRELANWISFSPRDFGIGVTFAALLTAIFAAIFFGFPRLAEHLTRLQAKNYAAFTHLNSWRAIIIISFFAGLWEEAFFRGGLQVILTDQIGAQFAILIVSALFAAVHLSKPLVGFLQFLIGCVFGVVYWQTGSLLAVILAHFLYDIFALWYLLRELRRLQIEDAAKAPDMNIAS